MAKYTPNFKNTEPVEFVLDEFTKGYAQCVDNCWNYAFYAQNPNVSIYQNEYNAGYVQGKVQGLDLLKATRNNSWKNFLVGSTPQDAISVEVKPEYLRACGATLVKNYDYTYEWALERRDDNLVKGIIRLMFRMFGIYEGANSLPARKSVAYEDLALGRLDANQLKLGAGDDPLTFLDVYFLNAQYDLFDAVGDQIGLVMGYGTAKKKDPADKPDHCTAFTKLMPDGTIYWTHNSWCCFWAQSCAVTYVIGEDFVTQNANCQGQFGSNTDFGFNGKGIGFNETTHVDLYDKTRIEGVWLAWRSAAAEQFAGSIQE
ncbi:MAG: hypothetical protein K2G75_01410, partial [Muribaculaceae bacterium]|nr:hypothetical protein [Muribaculaceae bacterium]